jgi:hypothetical protein
VDLFVPKRFAEGVFELLIAYGFVAPDFDLGEFMYLDPEYYEYNQAVKVLTVGTLQIIVVLQHEFLSEWLSQFDFRMCASSVAYDRDGQPILRIRSVADFVYREINAATKWNPMMFTDFTNVEQPMSRKIDDFLDRLNRYEARGFIPSAEVAIIAAVCKDIKYKQHKVHLHKAKQCSICTSRDFKKRKRKCTHASNFALDDPIYNVLRAQLCKLRLGLLKLAMLT